MALYNELPVYLYLDSKDIGTISVDTADVPGTNKIIVYSGLTSGTQYRFRVIASNSVGDSPKGTKLKYTTPN